jgi:hypothetical protein
LVHQCFGLLHFLFDQFPIFNKSLIHAVLSKDSFEVHNRLEDGHYNNVDVAELVLEGVAGCSVEKVSYREIELSLQIALLVVLLHFHSKPLEIQNAEFTGAAVV